MFWGYDKACAPQIFLSGLSLSLLAITYIRYIKQECVVTSQHYLGSIIPAKSITELTFSFNLWSQTVTVDIRQRDLCIIPAKDP